MIVYAPEGRGPLPAPSLSQPSAQRPPEAQEDLSLAAVLAPLPSIPTAGDDTPWNCTQWTAWLSGHIRHMYHALMEYQRMNQLISVSRWGYGGRLRHASHTQSAP